MASVSKSSRRRDLGAYVLRPRSLTATTRNVLTRADGPGEPFRAHRGEPPVESLDCLPMERRRDVAVGVEGHGNRAVAEKILYHLRVDAGLEEDRRSSVAQVVNTDSR